MPRTRGARSRRLRAMSHQSVDPGTPNAVAPRDLLGDPGRREIRARPESIRATNMIRRHTMTRTLVAALAILALCSLAFGAASAQTAGSGTGTDSYSNGSTSSDASQTQAQTDPQTTPGTAPSTTETPATNTGSMESSSSSSLPATAGPWPMIALFGLGALGGGTMLRRIRR